MPLADKNGKLRPLEHLNAGGASTATVRLLAVPATLMEDTVTSST